MFFTAQKGVCKDWGRNIIDCQKGRFPKQYFISAKLLKMSPSGPWSAASQVQSLACLLSYTLVIAKTEIEWNSEQIHLVSANNYPHLLAHSSISPASLRMLFKEEVIALILVNRQLLSIYYNGVQTTPKYIIHRWEYKSKYITYLQADSSKVSNNE